MLVVHLSRNLEEHKKSRTSSSSFLSEPLLLCASSTYLEHIFLKKSQAQFRLRE